jgi:hypothetical protein
MFMNDLNQGSRNSHSLARSESVETGGKYKIVVWSIFLVRFEVLTVVVTKSTVFWYLMLCSLLKVNRHFGGIYCRHLRGWRISQARNQHESRWQAEQLACQNFGLYRRKYGMVLWSLHLRNKGKGQRSLVFVIHSFSICRTYRWVVEHCKIWSPHRGSYEDYCLLRYNAV